MSHDPVTEIVTNDSLILSFGNFLTTHNSQATKHAYISQRLSQLSRLMQKLRELSKNENSSLASFLVPESFDMLIEVVYAVCHYVDEEKSVKFSMPSLALKLGHSIRKCCGLLIGKALRE